VGDVPKVLEAAAASAAKQKVMEAAAAVKPKVGDVPKMLEAAAAAAAKQKVMEAAATAAGLLKNQELRLEFAELLCSLPSSHLELGNVHEGEPGG